MCIKCGFSLLTSKGQKKQVRLYKNPFKNKNSLTSLGVPNMVRSIHWVQRSAKAIFQEGDCNISSPQTNLKVNLDTVLEGLLCFRGPKKGNMDEVRAASGEATVL